MRASASDHAWLHFGAPGATATLASPSGATLRVTYAPTTPAGCPPALPAPAEDVLARCVSVPAVARVSFAGSIGPARAAHDPGLALPASWFHVVCTPSPYAPAAEGPCLVGAAVDGTWTLTPAQQGPRARLQPKAPAGMLVSVQGKALHDVAPDSGDITSTGSGQNSRDPLMPDRLWDWHKQAPWTTYAACSGGLAAPCTTESGIEERPLAATGYVGP